MKTKHEFILALIATSMLVFAIQGNTVRAADPATQSKEGKSTVHLKITGIIKNFDEFLACVARPPQTTFTTFIQLVRADANQTFFGDDGSTRIISDLEVWKVPTEAAFNFEASAIPPGRYVLVAQQFGCSPGRTGQPKPPLFFKSDEKAFVVDIPTTATSPIIIEAGALIVRTR